MGANLTPCTTGVTCATGVRGQASTWDLHEVRTGEVQEAAPSGINIVMELGLYPMITGSEGQGFLQGASGHLCFTGKGGGVGETRRKLVVGEKEGHGLGQRPRDKDERMEGREDGRKAVRTSRQRGQDRE